MARSSERSEDSTASECNGKKVRKTLNQMRGHWAGNVGSHKLRTQSSSKSSRYHRSTPLLWNHHDPWIPQNTKEDNSREVKTVHTLQIKRSFRPWELTPTKSNHLVQVVGVMIIYPKRSDTTGRFLPVSPLKKKSSPPVKLPKISQCPIFGAKTYPNKHLNISPPSGQIVGWWLMLVV